MTANLTLIQIALHVKYTIFFTTDGLFLRKDNLPQNSFDC